MAYITHTLTRRAALSKFTVFNSISEIFLVPGGPFHIDKTLHNSPKLSLLDAMCHYFFISLSYFIHWTIPNYH